ncbi:hypothetical protein [Leptolyngbya sp. Heron Island J]|uniref:hypothetical protein n=1 Tax=Leptolyngbya sp. Heron Island J TaxID=1385935 RepID=UPI001268D73D|nr:hypothetical protein [Leptolyngbya sp. Heron Island J]
MIWHDWLLIACFIAISTWGLRLAWLWCYQPRYAQWKRRSKATVISGKFGRSGRRLYYDMPRK